MSALNQQETAQLGFGMAVLSALRTELQLLADGGTIPPGRAEFLAKEAKKAYDAVHTVRTMKGYYPK